MSGEIICRTTDRTTTDRRQVTVLFADLVDFTALAEHTDPEDLRDLQTAFFEAVVAPIHAHGGVVEKYIGDAVLAVFGVPQAHEDDAVRAARAALAMHTALTPLNERLSRERGFRLALRIGIHTGLVVATVEPNGDFVITGDTVNLAERFQEAAEPGSVLVGAETQALIADAFEPFDPELAQFEMSVETYAAILADLKPRFIHHAESKRLIQQLLRKLGCDETQTYFDVPRLRSSTSHDYLTTGIAYAFHPHRDTWYSAHCTPATLRRQ